MSYFSNLFNRNQSEKKFTPRTETARKVDAYPKPRKHESLFIFLIALAINLAAASLLNFVWVIGEVDALSTTANGFLTLYSANTGIMPITLVEPPLPGLLQLLFIPILKEFGLTFFAGPLLTSLAGALSLLFLNLILLLLNVKPGFRWVLLGLVQIYPTFLYTSATGTAEALFLLIALFVIWGALQITYNNVSFLICGFGLAIGFFIKYESIAITIGIVLALLVYQWKANDNWRSELEGRLIAFITPVIYAICLWLIFNGMNLDDSFYFIRHLFTPAYSPDIARNATVLHPFFLGWDHIFEAFRTGISRIWQNSLVFSATTVFAFLVAIISKRKYYYSVLLIVLSIPLLDIIKIFLGLQSPWLYQWVYVVPFGMILIGMLSQHILPEKRYLLLIFTVLLTGFSMALTLDVMGGEDVSLGEQRLQALLTGDPAQEIELRNSDPYWVYRQDSAVVASEIDTLPEESTILVNAADAAPVTLFVEHPGQLIITSEIDFDSFFTYPGNQADYVFLLQENQPINPSYTVQEYPALSEASVNYAPQVWQSDGTYWDWRLYALNVE